MKSSLILSWSSVRLLTAKSQDVMRRIFHFSFCSGSIRLENCFFSWFLLLCLPVYRWNWEIVSRLTPVTGCWKLKVVELREWRHWPSAAVELWWNYRNKKLYSTFVCLFTTQWVSERENFTIYETFLINVYIQNTQRACVCIWNAENLLFTRSLAQLLARLHCAQTTRMGKSIGGWQAEIYCNCELMSTS